MFLYFFRIIIILEYMRKIRFYLDIKLPNIYYIKDILIEYKEISSNNNINFIEI